MALGSRVGSYLDAARALMPKVLASADIIDRERELPAELANEIADRGFFRMLVPKSLGGGEIDYLDHLDIIQEFGKADGSTAWCINQNSVFATHSAVMPEATAREIWSDQRAVAANGPPTSSSNVVPVDGGYRLTGRWNFSSGCRHATWLAALTPVRYPGQDEGASKKDRQLLMLLVPKKDMELVDVWQVGGLRGTGSFSFEAKGLFVPRARTFNSYDSPRESGPLYVMPISLLFASGFASVALGVARGALDAVIELSGRKTPEGQLLLRDQGVVQRQIGQAEACWGAARAFLRETATTAWNSACNVHSLTLEERIQLRLSSTHAIRMSAEVVDVTYNVAGASAIFATNPIQRRFQDVYVIKQHLQGRMAHYDTAGKFFLGMDPRSRLEPREEF